MEITRKRYSILALLLLTLSFQASGSEDPNSDAGAQGCVLRNPSVVVTPEEQDAPPGSTTKYFVSVKNNNSAQCLPAFFHLSPVSFPFGESRPFHFIFETPTLQLSSGEKRGTPFTFRISSNIMLNSYLSFSVSARNTGDPRYEGFGHFICFTAHPPDPDPEPGACIQKPPTLWVSPQEGGGLPGTTMKYTLVVKNNNSGKCDRTSFALSTAPMTYLDFFFDPAYVFLLNGEFGETTLEVTSEFTPPPSEYGKVYHVEIKATNRSNEARVGKAWLQYRNEKKPI